MWLIYHLEETFGRFSGYLLTVEDTEPSASNKTKCPDLSNLPHLTRTSAKILPASYFALLVLFLLGLADLWRKWLHPPTSKSLLPGRKKGSVESIASAKTVLSTSGPSDNKETTNQRFSRDLSSSATPIQFDGHEECKTFPVIKRSHVNARDDKIQAGNSSVGNYATWKKDLDHLHHRCLRIRKKTVVHFNANRVIVQSFPQRRFIACLDIYLEPAAATPSETQRDSSIPCRVESGEGYLHDVWRRYSRVCEQGQELFEVIKNNQIQHASIESELNTIREAVCQLESDLSDYECMVRNAYVALGRDEVSTAPVGGDKTTATLHDPQKSFRPTHGPRKPSVPDMESTVAQEGRGISEQASVTGLPKSTSGTTVVQKPQDSEDTDSTADYRFIHGGTSIDTNALYFQSLRQILRSGRARRARKPKPSFLLPNKLKTQVVEHPWPSPSSDAMSVVDERDLPPNSRDFFIGDSIPLREMLDCIQKNEETRADPKVALLAGLSPPVNDVDFATYEWFFGSVAGKGRVDSDNESSDAGTIEEISKFESGMYQQQVKQQLNPRPRNIGENIMQNMGYYRGQGLGPESNSIISSLKADGVRGRDSGLGYVDKASSSGTARNRNRRGCDVRAQRQHTECRACADTVHCQGSVDQRRGQESSERLRTRPTPFVKRGPPNHRRILDNWDVPKDQTDFYHAHINKRRAKHHQDRVLHRGHEYRGHRNNTRRRSGSNSTGDIKGVNGDHQRHKDPHQLRKDLKNKRE